VRTTLSFIAIVLTFAGYFPYVRAIVRGESKPHVFSWIVWGMTTFIVFFAQLEGGGGKGAWPIGVSGAIAITVAILAWMRRADSSITRSDWIFFSMALTSIPLWYFTATPLWSVVVLTSADVLGFGPTLRKAYDHPYEENLTFWWMFTVRNSVAIAALETFSLTTLMFPVVTGVTCLLLVLLVAYRRRVVDSQRRGTNP
jgi:hypothetical protein